MEVILLGPDDLDAYVAHILRHMPESGVGGAPVFAPYDTGHAPDPMRVRDQRDASWRLTLDRPGWERAFGLRDGERIVGHAELKGGRLPAEMHRATLGMGIEAAYRGQGHGARLVGACIDLARQAGLAWIDLGVFGGNAPAIALYTRLGFRQVGVVPDRFRVDGRPVDDISMVLRLAP
jgi:RimJ/RimL family protein N-acetyltransferase